MDNVAGMPEGPDLCLDLRHSCFIVRPAAHVSNR